MELKQNKNHNDILKNIVYIEVLSFGNSKTSTIHIIVD